MGLPGVLREGWSFCGISFGVFRSVWVGGFVGVQWGARLGEVDWCVEPHFILGSVFYGR